MQVDLTCLIDRGSIVGCVPSERVPARIDALAFRNLSHASRYSVPDHSISGLAALQALQYVYRPSETKMLVRFAETLNPADLIAERPGRAVAQGELTLATAAPPDISERLFPAASKARGTSAIVVARCRVVPDLSRRCRDARVRARDAGVAE